MLETDFPPLYWHSDLFYFCCFYNSAIQTNYSSMSLHRDMQIDCKLTTVNDISQVIWNLLGDALFSKCSTLWSFNCLFTFNMAGSCKCCKFILCTNVTVNVGVECE